MQCHSILTANIGKITFEEFMTQSIKLFTFLTFLACVMSSAAGQEDKLRQLENKVGQEWNRIQEYVALAHQAIAQDPEFELSDDQAIEFQNFLVEHEPLKQSLMKLGGIKNAQQRLDAMIAIQAQMDGLAGKLDNEILLPHQVKFLKFKEFEQHIRWNNGNYIEVMKSLYGEDLNLSEEQQKKTDEAHKERLKQIEDANKEYAKKIKEINLMYRKKISDSLSVKQKSLIEKYSGKPIIPAD